MNTIRNFIETQYRHFNADALRRAAQAYAVHLSDGGKVAISLGGAMSTAELGVSLAEMIRQDKVHLICSTGANLEEDVFNLIGNTQYHRVPDYRHLTPDEEGQLLNRVTDTCIPEEVMDRVEALALKEWRHGPRCFPHEMLYRILRSGVLKKHYRIDPRESWMVAASEKNLPIVVPGWEDSTLGGMFAAAVIRGKVHVNVVRPGIEYMLWLANFYRRESRRAPFGMFQIGGGIAGDFLISVVPMLRTDVKDRKVPHWAYFCQISDSTTSYGSYSGAVPNEKITWDKLTKHSDRYIIESDATIVAPLIFAYVLGH